MLSKIYAIGSRWDKGLMGLKDDWNKEVKDLEFIREFVTRGSPNGKQWKKRGKVKFKDMKVWLPI